MKTVFTIIILVCSAPVFAADTGFSAHLFAKFQTKACTRCHDFFEQNLDGLAFKSHKERSVEMCVVCHQQSVTGFEHQEEWFAQSGLYTSGMDAKQTCEATMNALHAQFKSRILLRKQVEKHLFEDPRVLWGIEGATPKSGFLPGGTKEGDMVKGGMKLWKEQVKAWLDSGMQCQ